MTPRDFLYWLQGFLEIDGADEQKREGMTKEQVEVIKKHIELVLTNVTREAARVDSSLSGILPHVQTLIC